MLNLKVLYINYVLLFNLQYKYMLAGLVKSSYLMEIMIFTVAGFLIPSGWKVFPIFSAANFDSTLHENPFEFNPWRWFVRINSFPLSLNQLIQPPQ